MKKTRCPSYNEREYYSVVSPEGYELMFQRVWGELEGRTSDNEVLLRIKTKVSIKL